MNKTRVLPMLCGRGREANFLFCQKLRSDCGLRSFGAGEKDKEIQAFKHQHSTIAQIRMGRLV